MNFRSRSSPAEALNQKPAMLGWFSKLSYLTRDKFISRQLPSLETKQEYCTTSIPSSLFPALKACLNEYRQEEPCLMFWLSQEVSKIMLPANQDPPSPFCPAVFTQKSRNSDSKTNVLKEKSHRITITTQRSAQVSFRYEFTTRSSRRQRKWIDSNELQFGHDRSEKHQSL